MFSKISPLNRCLVILGICSISLPLYADLSPLCCCCCPWQITPYTPNLALTGLGGTNTIWAGNGLFPVVGNSDNLFYAAAEGDYAADTSGFGGVGLGYRQIVNNSAILGTYLYFDRSSSETTNEFSALSLGRDDVNFSVLSPGVEAMLQDWDWRANGYFPVGNHQDAAITGTGTSLGLPQYITFSGHNQFDQVVSFVDGVGDGVDTSLGYSIRALNRLRVAGGVYYYHPTDLSSIRGVEGNLTFPVNNRFSVFTSDTYDNVQHNTFGLGLKFTLGGVPNSQQVQTPDIQDRMTDLPERNLSMQDRGGSIPDESGWITRTPPFLERSNIWFFSSSGGSMFSAAAGSANCTIDNPCSGADLNSTTLAAINGISSGANIYVNSGNYGVGTLTFQNGQSIYGRTPGYQLPAFTTGNLPTLIGGLQLSGNDTVQAVQLLSDGTHPMGIFIQNGQNVLIDHDVIGILNANQGYVTDIALNNAQNVTIQNSTLNAFGQATNTQLLVNDILANNNSQLFVQNNSINAQLFETLNSNINVDLVSANGIDANDSTVTVKQNAFSITGNLQNSGSGSSIILATTFDNVTGISAVNNAHVTANNNSFTNLIFNESNTGSGSLVSSISGLFSITNSTITAANNNFGLIQTNVTLSGPGNLTAQNFGIDGEDASTINASGNLFNQINLTANIANSTGTNIVLNNIGALSASSSLVTLTGNVFNNIQLTATDSNSQNLSINNEGLNSSQQSSLIANQNNFVLNTFDTTTNVNQLNVTTEGIFSHGVNANLTANNNFFRLNSMNYNTGAGTISIATIGINADTGGFVNANNNVFNLSAFQNGLAIGVTGEDNNAGSGTIIGSGNIFNP